MPERAARLAARAARLTPADWFTGLVLGALTVLPISDQLHGVGPWALTGLAAVTVAAAVTARARFPVAALVIASIVLFVCQLLHGRPDATGADLVASLLLVYSVGARQPSREAMVSLAVALASMLGVSALGGNFDPAPPLVLAVPVFCCGRALRRWRLLNLTLQERSAALAAGCEAHAGLAVRDERMRIARELHDVVGHALSLMVVQAGAGRRVASSRPDDARRALDAIDIAGAQALQDLARLAALVDDEAEPAQTLGDLVGAASRAGLTIRVRGGSDLVLDRLATRIIQEALTNSLKHAGATSVDIELARDAERVTIAVVDGGRRTRGGGPAEVWSGGLGLVGMRERVAHAGGTLRAGPRSGGGWEVVAALPSGELPVTPPDQPMRLRERRLGQARG